MNKNLLITSIILILIGVSLISLNYSYYKSSGLGSHNLEDFNNMKINQNPYAKYFYPSIILIIIGILLLIYTFIRKK